MAQPENPALLEIRLFGQPAVCVRSQDVTRELTKRATWLLALLALRKGEAVERSKLAALLWPDSPDAAALHNLRQTLAAIRRVMGEAKDAIAASSPRTVTLDTIDVGVDLWQFDEACKGETAEELERAVTLYSEPLLVGCEEPFAIAARNSREHAFLDAADRLAALYTAQGNFAPAIPVLRRALAEDPYRESACRALMEALSESGKGPAALELFREFRARLRKEVRADVGAETKALFQEVRTKLLNPERAAATKQMGPRLPVPLTSLIGRAGEIEDVRALMGRCRLVTLTGPGGVGKTRLALAVAQALSKGYLDGVWFVDIAPLQSPENFSNTLASALRIQEEPSKPIEDTIAAAIGNREMLLILDNCEHVADAVARLLDQLLSVSAGLHVLATSRQSLGVRGELVWGVPTLVTPKASDSPWEVQRCDAVQLFLERSVRSTDRPPSTAELQAVASICRRLDGLALAIELAAARTKVLPVAEIEARLRDRFALLTSGNRSLERHQTLRSCIEWSWDLLPEEQRSLLSCLSVFRGGASLAAVEYVADQTDVLDLLSSLVDRSLAIAYEEAGEARYRLLETIREFAELALETEGLADHVRNRHRDFFLEAAQREYLNSGTPAEQKWFETLEIEHDNYRAAIEWCHTCGHEETAIRLCVALARFWDTHGHLREGRQQIERALRYPAPSLDAVIRERAHVHAGWMAGVQGDPHAAIEHYHRALPIAVQREDTHAQAIVLNCMASAYLDCAEYEKAEAMFFEALALQRQLERRTSAAMILSNLGSLCLCQDNILRASEFMEQSLAELGGPSANHPQISGLALTNLAFVEFRRGDYRSARQHALDALRFLYDASLLVDVPFALLNVALADAGLGDWARAVRLLGVADRLLTEQGSPPNAFLTRARDEALALARKQLGESAFNVAVSGGRLMNLDEALRLARSEPQQAAGLIGRTA